jgi:NADH-quinone oxidoreductase subunit F
MEPATYQPAGKNGSVTGVKFFMNHEVTDTSHELAEYRARGGYQALEKALRTLQPADVTKEVSAAGLLGHGGAAFPAGRKWGVIKPNDGEPHYVCMNADEGEPGTFKDRWILQHVPHLTLEGLILASYAIGGRHAFIYIRGEFDLPYRRIQGAVDEAYAAGLLGRNILGTEYSLDVVVYRGAGRQEGMAPQSAAAPDGEGAVSEADRGEQRGDAGECPGHPAAGGRGVP